MNHDDERIETMLRRYRPVGPRPALRERVLESARVWPARGRSWAIVRWSAAVAMLLVSLGLGRMAESINRETAAMLGVGQVRWTDEAEEIAQLLSDNGWARRYMALLLAASDYVGRSDLASSFGNTIGGIR